MQKLYAIQRSELKGIEEDRDRQWLEILQFYTLPTQYIFLEDAFLQL